MTFVKREHPQKNHSPASTEGADSNNGIGDNGFTLIEVLMAIMILSIGLLAIGKMQISSIKNNHSAMKYTRSTIVAQDQMEALIGTSFNAIANSTTTNADGYQTILTVVGSDLDGDSSDDIKTVNIVVNDPLGKKRIDINFVKAADI